MSSIEEWKIDPLYRIHCKRGSFVTTKDPFIYVCDGCGKKVRYEG